MEVQHSNTSHSYIGMCSGPFKLRYNNHTKSFRNKTYANETELSKFVWELKEKKQDFAIEWAILKHATTKRKTATQCRLCLEEKLAIITAHSRKESLLNKRSELVSKCRHIGLLNRDRRKR